MRTAERTSTQTAKALRKRMTRAEVILWRHLRKKQLGGHRVRRQVPIGPYVADFACMSARVVIEVDGATHGTDAEIVRDDRRTQHLREAGWYVHRVWNTDIYQNLDSVLDGIGNVLADSVDGIERGEA